MLAAQNIYPDLQAASSTLLERLEQLLGKYNFERLIWPDLTWPDLTWPDPGVETTNQFHATGKTAWGINILQAEKQILLNF